MTEMTERRPKSADDPLFYDRTQPQDAAQRFNNQRKNDLDAYINSNGLYLKQQHLDQAQRLGLDQTEIVEIERDWRDAIVCRREAIKARARGEPRELDPKRKAIVKSVIADYEAQKREAEEDEEPEPEDEQQEPATGQLVPVELEPEEPEPETRPIFTPRAIIKLNRKHAVIANLGGKCVIMEFVPSSVTPGTTEPSYQTFRSFRERYLNQYLYDEISDKKISIGQFWLAHPRRRQYEGIDLIPDGPAVLSGNIFNLWRGWGVEPKKGDWSLLRKHVREVLANGDQKFDDYIIRWGAWTFQHAGERTGAALVLRGGKGSGKGVWGDVFMTIFGEHGLQIFDPTHLTGKHNAHLQNKLFLFADEAFWAGDKTAERTLKGVVTEKRMMIEPKGINAFPWPNRMSLYMAANEKWVVPASHDERRYAVSNVNERWKKNWSYFQPLLAEIAAGAPAAMLYDLERMKLGD